MLLQQLPVDARLVVEPLQVGLRHELQQVAVAVQVTGQHRQVERLAFARAAVPRPRRDVRLQPDDRLDPPRLRFPVEVDRSVQRPVVRHRDRIHAKRLRAVQQLRDARHAVEQRKFGVRV